MSDNTISYEEYKKLLAAGQDYVRKAQAADPEWAAWQQEAAAYNPTTSDTLRASPDKDYWAQYTGTLSPQQALGFQQNMADSKSWTDQVGSVLKYAIPAAVGGAGLAATGLLGAPLQAAVGGAPLGGSVGTLGSVPGLSFSGSLPEIGAFGGAPAGGFETLGSAFGPAYAAIPSSGVPGAAAAAQAIAAAGGSATAAGQALLDAFVKSGGKSFIDKIPDLLKTAGGLLDPAIPGGGSGGGGGGLQAFGYKPYQPPAAPAPVPFKAPTGLMDFAKGLQNTRKPRSLIGF